MVESSVCWAPVSLSTRSTDEDPEAILQKSHEGFLKMPKTVQTVPLSVAHRCKPSPAQNICNATTGEQSEDGAARWAATEGHKAWQTSQPMLQTSKGNVKFCLAPHTRKASQELAMSLQ